MGLVFYGKGLNRSDIVLHKQRECDQQFIKNLTVHSSTLGSSGKTVKRLSPENLKFLNSIGLFKK